MFATHDGYSLADIAAATGGNRQNQDGYGSSWWIIILFLFVFMGGGDFGNGFGNRGGAAATAAANGALTRADLSQDMNFQELSNSVRGVQSGLCDGFYSANTAVLNGFNGVDNAICTLGYQVGQESAKINSNIASTANASNIAMLQGFNGVTAGQNTIANQIQSCCCETGHAIQQGFCDTNYNMATNTNNIIQATHGDADRIIARLDAIETNRLREQLDEARRQNQTLEFTASQCSQNAYLINALAPKAPVPAFTVPNPYAGYGYGCSCNCAS
jgi:hypothetical protein